MAQNSIAVDERRISEHDVPLLLWIRRTECIKRDNNTSARFSNPYIMYDERSYL